MDRQSEVQHVRKVAIVLYVHQGGLPLEGCLVLI